MVSLPERNLVLLIAGFGPADGLGLLPLLEAFGEKLDDAVVTGDEVAHVPLEFGVLFGSFFTNLSNIATGARMATGGGEEHGNDDFFLEALGSNDVF